MGEVGTDRIALPDGRSVGYMRWGRPGGRPMILFHGAPGARSFCPDAAVTEELGFDLVVLERPGYGLSSPHPARTMLSWAEDTMLAADALGWNDFHLVGFSTGGPHALACAVQDARRLRSLTVVSGARGPVDEHPGGYSPSDVGLVERARKDPAAAAAILARDEWCVSVVRDPGVLTEKESVSPEDAWVLDDEAALGVLESSARESVRQGVEGMVSDRLAQLLEWGFRLADVPADVTFFHAEKDVIEDAGDVELVTGKIRGATVRTWRSAGHLGIMRHWRDVLETARSSE